LDRVGARGQERAAHGSVAARRRLHQGREARLGAVLGVRTPRQQQRDHVRAALEAGERERRVAVRLDVRVHVGARVQQQARRRRVPVHARQHERRDAQLRAWPPHTVLQEQVSQLRRTSWATSIRGHNKTSGKHTCAIVFKILRLPL